MTTLLPAPVAGTDEPGDGTTRWSWIATATLAGAAALHVGAAADHVDAGDSVVGFFLLVAFTQLAAAVWLAAAAVLRSRPAPSVVAAVLALTVGLLLLYLVGHTTDLLAGFSAAEHSDHPAGTTAPHAGGHEAHGPTALGLEPLRTGESPGLLGTGAVALEVVSVLALAALLPAVLRRRVVNGLLALGVLTWLSWFFGLPG